jgi:basic membrane lipoprotein Med (substrate-binding protein (PBP1-ABC) superfamily)
MIAALALGTALTLALPAWAQDITKVAAIWTVPVEQQWASRLHNALIAAKDRGEIDYVYSENVTNTDYERVMREYAEQGVALMVGEAFGVEQPARAVAADYPDIKFLMGSSLPAVEPNFATFDNFIHEPSYLTGMVAGAKTESNQIGMVGGYAIPEVNRLMNAFMAGALSVNPDIKFSVSFINSWYDPPKAKETAFAMIDAGADILYAERFGVSDAAKERGILAIGNVIDTAADYPGTILASALWHGEPMIDKAIADVKAGSFTASDYGIYAFMEHGGSSAVYDEALAGAEAVAAAKAKEAEIVAGTFTVEINDAEPASTM